MKDEPQDAKEKIEVIDDDSDDDIEVVSFKTSDNRTFYALKDEAKEEQKKKGTALTHVCR